MVKAVEKAISNAGLGLNPVADGQTVRVPIPELTEERRKELSKVASKYAESGKVAVRNARRDAMDEIKKLEKDKKISEDDARKFGEDIQKITDERIKKIDEMLAQKEKDIMQV
jgi:ribosome recycling factor